MYPGVKVGPPETPAALFASPVLALLNSRIVSRISLRCDAGNCEYIQGLELEADSAQVPAFSQAVLL